MLRAYSDPKARNRSLLRCRVRKMPSGLLEDFAQIMPIGPGICQPKTPVVFLSGRPQGRPDCSDFRWSVEAFQNARCKTHRQRGGRGCWPETCRTPARSLTLQSRVRHAALRGCSTVESQGCGHNVVGTELRECAGEGDRKLRCLPVA